MEIERCFDAEQLRLVEGVKLPRFTMKKPSHARWMELRGLQPGAAVWVLDDYGNVWETEIRAPAENRGTSRRHNWIAWLEGVRGCYALERVRRPGGWR